MTENNENEKAPDLENLAPEDEIELICDACGEEFTVTKAEIDEGADVSYCPECLAELSETEEEEEDLDDEDDLDDDDEEDLDDEDDLDEDEDSDETDEDEDDENV